MNINNFENKIDKTIVSRGYNYYINGHVAEAFEQGNNVYAFYIEGSDDYEVLVELGDNGDIVYSECDCPYDFGPVCKHEVASYYKLNEMLNPVPSSGKKTKKNQKRITIEEVMSQLPKEELVNIILNIASNDPTLETSLILKYAKGDHEHELESCQELINAIIRKYKGREGFIKYRETSAFVNELGDVIDKIRDTADVLLALELSLLLLKKAIGAFQYADDSDGDIGYLVTETLELIQEIVTNQNEKSHRRTEIFEKLLVQLDQAVFDGWEDYKIELLQICFEFADEDNFRAELRLKMESMLVDRSSDRYTDYWNESLLKLLFQLIEQYGSQEDAEQFIYEHLQFSSFREKLITNYLQAENYHKVIEVAKEGEIQDQQYRGLLSKWKKYRYTAYKSLSLKKEQSQLAKELLLAGDFDYYHDLKEIAQEEHQGDFYTKLKEELKTEKGWNHRDIFLKMIEFENDLEEMLEFVRKNPSYIENYSKKLSQQYKEEVIEIYQKYITSIARNSSNRREYQGVCRKIKEYKKIAGKPKQVDLINELMSLNKKRPAFLDELGKL
ncbi:hypothetical protein [Bacillus sp. T3]|uniref:SWIM zinc finger family protein n=1 Tax=Bacillus sp. T3 TaxID=467262 RepID=UPI002980A694|nr:hypothetical protein [Bacillus sp. T3]